MPRSPLRISRRFLIGVALSALASSSCRQAPEPTAPGGAAQTSSASSSAVQPKQMPPITAPAVRILKRSELTPAEVLYGRGPMPDPSVVYNPGVVIVEGGAQAIRGLSPDGLIWTIDPDAPGASRLRVGTIAFVTGRCVGRVLAVDRGAGGLSLLLGPVQLTDIYEQLEIQVDDQPIDLAEAIETPPPQFPGSSAPLQRQVDPFSNWNLDNVAGIRPASAQPVSPGIPNAVRTGMHTGTIDTHRGPGMTLRADSHGLRLAAQMQFRMAAPRFNFKFKIYYGKVYVIAELKNVATLRVAFDAATSEQFLNNYKWTQSGPSMSIPLAGPTPFSLDVRQDLSVTTAFSARQSSFGAGGTYRLDASLGLQYTPTTGWDITGPKGLTVQSPLMSTMTGVSVGPAGVIFEHELTITAGFGAAGFTVGPMFSLQTSLGAAQGSTAGVVQCREAALGMKARAAIGYTIPKIIVDVTNFFLSFFKVTPIKDHNPIIKTDWQKLFEPIRVKPGGQACIAETAPSGS